MMSASVGLSGRDTWDDTIEISANPRSASIVGYRMLEARRVSVCPRPSILVKAKAGP
jgi:hypothetical protein